MTTAREDLPLVRHNGWAPCAHDDESRARFEAEYLIEGATVEDLMFVINNLGPAPSCAVDQWWGVSAEAPLWRDRDRVMMFRTWIQGDSLLLALTETFKVWRAKYEEVSGVSADQGLHDIGYDQFIDPASGFKCEDAVCCPAVLAAQVDPDAPRSERLGWTEPWGGAA